MQIANDKRAEVLAEIEDLLSQIEPEVLIVALDQMFESHYISSDKGKDEDVYFGYKYLRTMAEGFDALLS